MDMVNLTCSSSNLSRDSITEDLWVLEGEFKTNGLIIAVFEILFVLVGAPANTFIVGSILKHRLYQQPAFISILNLAISDLLVCLLLLPVNITSGIAGTSLLGGSDFARCQFCTFWPFLTILPFESAFSVMLISIDRFLFIKRPLNYEKLVTVCRMVISVVVTWLASITLGLLPFFRFGRRHFSLYIAACVVDFNNSRYFLVVLIVMTAVIVSTLVLINGWVVCIVQKHLRQIYAIYKSSSYADHKQQMTARTEHYHKQLSIIRVFAAIFFTDVFTLIPTIVLIIVSASIGIDAIPVGFTTLAFLFLVLQSMLHPILVFCLENEIKQPVLKLLQQDSRSTPTSNTCDSTHCCGILVLAPDYN